MMSDVKIGVSEELPLSNGTSSEIAKSEKDEGEQTPSSGSTDEGITM